MKQDWRPDELRATSEEIRGAIMPKSITPEMVGGTLVGLVNAVGEIVETLGEIPREHVKVRVNTLDSEGITAHSTDATVYVDIFTTKGYPAVNMPRQEIKVDGEGLAEFDVPHGFQFAVYAKHPGLSASFQWVYTAAIAERPIIVLWCVPVGVWWMGAIFHSSEEDIDWGDEVNRPTPCLFDHYTCDDDEFRERAEVDLRPDEQYMDYYNYGIMVATADTCFVVSPHSFSEETMVWCNNRTRGMYIPGMEHINLNTESGEWQVDYAEAQNRARADMDGNMNTAKILGAVSGALAAEWAVLSGVYDYLENRWLPSAGQMYLIWLNRTAINRLMQEAMADDADSWAYALLPYQNDKGQWQRPNGRYEYWWTSTVFDDYCSWVVNCNGYVYRNIRIDSYDVRAVSAFHFEY